MTFKLIKLSQSEVPDEPPLYQLCTLPLSHSDLGLDSGVLPLMSSGFGGLRSLKSRV